MTHFTVLLTAPYMLQAIDRFKPFFEKYGLDLVIPDVNERMEEADLLKYAGKYDATVCGDDRYNGNVLKACTPRLRVIAKWGTGIDSIDLQEAARLGIQVRNTPNAFTLPVADSVMGYLLAFARQLPWMDREMKAGHWQKIPGVSLSECTLGVVGIGNCGKAVIRRARSFGMRILGNDIIPIAPDFILEYGVEMTSLEDLLKRSDFVSLNCDLNLTSYHLMNESTLAFMKPVAILINAARGPIIDEPALIRALQSKVIAGAGLDVFEYEPLPADSPLRTMDQVLLAPHNANSSPAAWERVHRNSLRNLLEGLELPYDVKDLENL